LKGPHQIVVRAYAEALEIIPETLAENSGLDTIKVYYTILSNLGCH